MAGFEARKWDRTTQLEFAERLKEIPTFEGKISKTDPGFSARDRAAPQKTFGFVYVDGGRYIHMTRAGQRLIEGVRPKELFLKQLLKWQYPSPQHCGPEYEYGRMDGYTRAKEIAKEGAFWTLPFVDTLAVIRRVGGLTKHEIATFMLPKIRMGNIGPTVEAVLKYRRALERKKNRRDRREFKEIYLRKAYARVYRKELQSVARLRGKDRARKELLAKAGSARDVADATIRHFRMTTMLTVDNGRLAVPAERIEDVDAILAIGLVPRRTFRKAGEFYEYLGNPELPILPWEDPGSLRDKAQTVAAQIEEARRQSVRAMDYPPPQLPELSSLGMDQLKDLVSRLESARADVNRILLEDRVRSTTNKDILDRYAAILKPREHEEIFDPPVEFEWNTYKALVAINHGEVKPNTVVDEYLQPIDHAPRGLPDASADFGDVRLAIEVTLKSSDRQYKDENEPVTDHVGKYQKAQYDAGFRGTVVGLFIAPTLVHNSLQWFHYHKNMAMAPYGPPVVVIPLELRQFTEIISFADALGGSFSREEIVDLFHSLAAAARQVSHPEGWIRINDSVIFEWQNRVRARHAT